MRRPRSHCKEHSETVTDSKLHNLQRQNDFIFSAMNDVNFSYTKSWLSA